MNEDRLKFDFLQVAIGTKNEWHAALSDNDWLLLYEFCQRQALLGIGFVAVERLHTMGVMCPLQLKMKWFGIVIQIERQNELLNEQCRKLTEKYRHDGLQCCILKGQGNLLSYPEELRTRRQSGDIDVWVIPEAETGLSIPIRGETNSSHHVTYYGKRAVREYVRWLHRITGNFEKIPVRYHHIDAPDMSEIPVEVHFRIGHFASPLRNWRLQRWFELHTDECMTNDTKMGFAIPTASVNVIFQMMHMFAHYMDEGLGLRQLLDYYYALKLWNEENKEKGGLQKKEVWSESLTTPVMSREEIDHTIKWLGMAKFSAAVMWVLNEVFALPSHYHICRSNEREGKRLLQEILLAGNFGHYDQRGVDMKTGGMMRHSVWKLNRIMRLARSYPEEAIFEPFFRFWHWCWRKVIV